MSDNNPKLGVEYVVTTTGDGSKKTAEGIKEVKQAAAETKPVQEQLSQAHSETAKATEKVTNAKKGMTEAMKAARTEIPVLSRALHLLHSPFAALGLAIGVAWEWLRKLHEELDRSEERQQKLERLNDALGRFSPNAFNATTRAREFVRELDAIIEKGHGASEMLGTLNELLQERLRLSSDVDSQEKAARLAEVDDRRKKKHEEIDASGLSPAGKDAAKAKADKEAADEKAKIERQHIEAERMRQRQADLEKANAYESAANAEAGKAQAARYLLPEASKKTIAAEDAADAAETAAEGAKADFDARAPELLKKIRDAKAKVGEMAQLDPDKPLHGGDAKQWRSGVLLGREKAQKELDDREAEYKDLERGNNLAKHNARVARRTAGERLGEEQELRGTIKDSTTKAIELGETGERIRAGVLRSAAADPYAERSRPAGSTAGDGLATAAGQFSGAGQRMEHGAGEIVRVGVGLNTAIGNLERAIQALGDGGAMNQLIARLSRIESDLRLLTIQVKNNR